MSTVPLRQTFLDLIKFIPKKKKNSILKFSLIDRLSSPPALHGDIYFSQ
jgi:hypothetical protein